jgi:hypothetical protein
MAVQKEIRNAKKAREELIRGLEKSGVFDKALINLFKKDAEADAVAKIALDEKKLDRKN